ncbi:MAG: hypothetical protein LBO65_04230 [Spirochaetaceae bacterium]|nr:hypothetical protein [Spirochaetaceae bacterium]
MFVLYLLKNIFLVLDIADLNVIVLLVTMVIHSGIVFMVYRRKINPLPHLLVWYGILILSLVISTMIFDYSWDGQIYHQVTVLHLKNGWNPFYSHAPKSTVSLYNDCYPKFTELFGSIFSSICNNIEVGKAYNIVFIMITFCYALRYTGQYHKNKLAVLVLSIFFVINPVVVAQFFTYLVDGFMGMTIIILFFACIYFEQEHDIKDIIIIIATSIFALNTKFTGFICGIVLIGYIFRQFILKRYKQMTTLIVSGAIILALGVFFAGFNPYVTNFRDFGHPFYPLFGENKIDIIYTINMPKNLLPMHPIQRFFSLFLLDYEKDNLPFNPLKITKLSSHGVPDLRTGGFGVFLAEIFIFISIIVFLSMKNNQGRYKAVFFPVLLLAAISIIMPENWWARYIPYFWYLFGFFIIVSNYSNKQSKILFFILLLIIVINNVSFFAFNTANAIKFTAEFKQCIAEIKKSKHDTVHLILGIENFNYAYAEKMMFYNVDKDIIFIINSEAPVNKGVYLSAIRDWY